MDKFDNRSQYKTPLGNILIHIIFVVNYILFSWSWAILVDIYNYIWWSGRTFSWLNIFTGNIPKEIGYLHNLQLLNMNSNNLSGHLPRQIWNITSLLQLHLYNNSLTGMCTLFQWFIFVNSNTTFFLIGILIVLYYRKKLIKYFIFIYRVHMHIYINFLSSFCSWNMFNKRNLIVSEEFLV